MRGEGSGQGAEPERDGYSTSSKQHPDAVKSNYKYTLYDAIYPLQLPLKFECYSARGGDRRFSLNL